MPTDEPPAVAAPVFFILKAALFLLCLIPAARGLARVFLSGDPAAETGGNISPTKAASRRLRFSHHHAGDDSATPSHAMERAVKIAADVWPVCVFLHAGAF